MVLASGETREVALAAANDALALIEVETASEAGSDDLPASKRQI
jgi:predicted RNase H-like HicB family nuclease